ncbi:DUF3169 family protein [Paraclostridium bifermentans]|uniref:DUF3169 family protein n=1 Tax=Paraclostridium TaxID=1849822 RepID=UPI001CC608A4|nr:MULTISPECIES: DUF3169 family protein [Paraclostridium]MBZ6006946.1 DUF3169 family protein [Paraclostridium bifermentans]MCU9809714.1 DUF3169 family protein [Paraclostridium sp. AKS46]MDU0296987.1 DUF3169 family protein [Paraclostridium sp. MRS3W1]
MSNKCMDEIKKEDKKAFKSFIVMIVISLVAGHFLGRISGNLKQIMGENVSSSLINMLKYITPFASLVLSILLILVFKIIYTDSRKSYELWKKSNEDDNRIDKIEENLSYLRLLSSIINIIGMFFIGIGAMLLPFDDINGDISITKYICFSIGLILCVTSNILIQKKIINLRKEINPLLKGSVYDIKFAKKWVDSCDESVKLGIFKSAYKAYVSVSKTCIILWLFCIIGYDLWNFGIMPLVIVTIIWLVQTISYCLESIKYSKAQ